MSLENYLALFIIGVFLFIGGGLSIANSIEAKESKSVANFLIFMIIAGLACIMISVFGYILTLIKLNL